MGRCMDWSLGGWKDQKMDDLVWVGQWMMDGWMIGREVGRYAIADTLLPLSLCIEPTSSSISSK